jgi:hypothetical protein
MQRSLVLIRAGTTFEKRALEAQQHFLNASNFFAAFALKITYVQTNYCDSGKFLVGSYGAVL